MIMALKRKLKKIVNSLSIFMLVGCSYYSMAGSIPANINNVYIPLIENDTAEFEISENFRIIISMLTTVYATKINL